MHLVSTRRLCLAGVRICVAKSRICGSNFAMMCVVGGDRHCALMTMPIVCDCSCFAEEGNSEEHARVESMTSRTCV